MSRVWYAVAGLALVAALALVSSPSGAADKKLNLKEIMTKAHKGGTSLLATVGAELKEDEPDWAEVQTKSKELVQLGTAMTKATPPRGEKESWDKLTAAYLQNAKALNAAAGKKAKTQAQAAQKKLATSCRSCHTAHKPK